MWKRKEAPREKLHARTTRHDPTPPNLLPPPQRVLGCFQLFSASKRHRVRGGWLGVARAHPIIKVCPPVSRRPLAESFGLRAALEPTTLPMSICHTSAAHRRNPDTGMKETPHSSETGRATSRPPSWWQVYRLTIGARRQRAIAVGFCARPGDGLGLAVHTHRSGLRWCPSPPGRSRPCHAPSRGGSFVDHPRTIRVAPLTVGGGSGGAFDASPPLFHPRPPFCGPTVTGTCDATWVHFGRGHRDQWWPAGCTSRPTQHARHSTHGRVWVTLGPWRVTQHGFRHPEGRVLKALPPPGQPAQGRLRERGVPRQSS